MEKLNESHQMFEYKLLTYRQNHKKMFDRDTNLY